MKNNRRLLLFVFILFFCQTSSYAQIQQGILLANGGLTFQFSKKQSHNPNDIFFKDALLQQSHQLNYGIDIGVDYFVTDKWSSGVYLSHVLSAFNEYYTIKDNQNIEHSYSSKKRDIYTGLTINATRYFEFKQTSYFSLGGSVSAYYATSWNEIQSDYFQALPDKTKNTHRADFFGYTIGLIPGYLKWINPKTALELQLPIRWSRNSQPNLTYQTINIGLAIGVKYLLK